MLKLLRAYPQAWSFFCPGLGKQKKIFSHSRELAGFGSGWHKYCSVRRCRKIGKMKNSQEVGCFRRN
jgi:hypothetical protein